MRQIERIKRKCRRVAEYHVALRGILRGIRRLRSGVLQRIYIQWCTFQTIYSWCGVGLSIGRQCSSRLFLQGRPIPRWRCDWSWLGLPHTRGAHSLLDDRRIFLLNVDRIRANSLHSVWSNVAHCQAA